MNKLEELEKKYKELGEEIERLKTEEKNAKGWKPKRDEEFYYFFGDGEVTRSLFDDDYEGRHWEMGNCFKTRKEAIAMVEKIKIYKELKRLVKAQR